MTPNDYEQKLKQSARWKNWLTLILLATVPAILNAASCQEQSGQAPDIAFHGKPYATDSQTSSIVRLEQGEVHEIKCHEPEFDNRMCYTISEIAEHLKDLEAIKTQCKQWKNPTAEQMVQPYINKMRKDAQEAFNIVNRQGMQ